MRFPKMAKLKTADQFRERVAELQIDLDVDPELDIAQDTKSPANLLAASLSVGTRTIGNRFCVLPMEGWDGNADGSPSELTRRRWLRFANSGAKLLWGCEAVAVLPSGRANPRQLTINEGNLEKYRRLLDDVRQSHRAGFGTDDDLFVGLQLTHSGRYTCREAAIDQAPRRAWIDPVRDSETPPLPIWTDEQLDQVVDAFVQAARLAEAAGFDFVDIKHCHGYLGNELLGDYTRPGRFGTSFENRTRFLFDIIDGIQSTTQGLAIGVRLSLFDGQPFIASQGAAPVSENTPVRRWGMSEDGQAIDLAEPIQLVERLLARDVRMICTTAGSPYYNPHVQRPAAFPPSDGYPPPEDPLVGVARQIHATGKLKKACPAAVVIGSACSYLQQWIPNVAHWVVRTGRMDLVGLGRAALSYPDLPADVLAGRPLMPQRLCRTFSDCTTAPRHGMISGCYPLDPFYKQRPEAHRLVQIKQKRAF